jgi:PncC family amidohydrolase
MADPFLGIAPFRKRVSDVPMKRKRTLEQQVGRALLDRGWDLALAESCTGGLIGFRITAVSGSSGYFCGGVVAYENRVKERLLGVRSATLRLHGAVSAETAVEMARGARRLFGAKVALSVTGVAGPGGGTEAKPVGLVYAAACSGRKKVFTERHFAGGREHVRRRAADMALELLLSLIEGHG